MKQFVPVLCALFAVALPVHAQPATSGGACLRQNRVDGWKVVDDQTLIVNDRVGHRFTVSLAKGCHDLKWPMHLGFSAGTGFGLSCLARHDFVYVPATGGDVPQRCLIEDIQPYPAAPVAGATAAPH